MLPISFSEIDELALALRRIANNGIEESLKEYESILNGCKCCQFSLLYLNI